MIHTDAHISMATNLSNCFMPIVKVEVSKGNKTVTVKAALDTLSSASFCTQSLADKLDLKGESHAYVLKTMSGVKTKTSDHVSFDVSACSENMHMSGVKVVDQIPICTADVDISEFDHVKGIDVTASIACRNVDILIGQDHSIALLPLKVISGSPNSPFAVKYLLGWGLSGSVRKTEVSSAVICNFISVNNASTSLLDESTACDVNKLWNIENSVGNSSGLSIEDRKVINLWDETCRKTEGHYELPVPWRAPRERVPNNIHCGQK